MKFTAALLTVLTAIACGSRNPVASVAPPTFPETLVEGLHEISQLVVLDLNDYAVTSKSDDGTYKITRFLKKQPTELLTGLKSAPVLAYDSRHDRLFYGLGNSVHAIRAKKTLPEVLNLELPEPAPVVDLHYSTMNAKTYVVTAGEPKVWEVDPNKKTFKLALNPTFFQSIGVVELSKVRASSDGTALDLIGKKSGLEIIRINLRKKRVELSYPVGDLARVNGLEAYHESFLLLNGDTARMTGLRIRSGQDAGVTGNFEGLQSSSAFGMDLHYAVLAIGETPESADRIVRTPIKTKP